MDRYGVVIPVSPRDTGYTKVTLEQRPFSQELALAIIGPSVSEVILELERLKKRVEEALVRARSVA